MNDHSRHDHSFGQDLVRAGERRTRLVIAITAAMTAVEIAAGLAFGSMALLADGLHMASHAAALGISAAAYLFVRRRARDPRYSFGTGKMNALGGFASGVVLLLFALFMAGESARRFFAPVAIVYDQAILVAILGLAVNGASVFILGGHHEGVKAGGGTGSWRGSRSAPAGDDHNLRAAYLHVLADAATSILAIAALLAGKLAGLAWMDPLMGIAGAALIARWSTGLLRDTGGVLLDVQAPDRAPEAIRSAIEREPGTKVSDLHVWCIGPGICSAAISIVADEPKPPEYYRSLLPDDLGLVHATIEIHSKDDGGDASVPGGENRA
ncbi:MAG: cation transporter [Candidatus Latescibacterota bacterium]|nr:MAG: cation transporter [Candidatus Latescibacterota bacterium]